MKVTATEFKAKCLALIDRVHTKGDSITITKRGRVVAKLVPDHDVGERPWLALRGKLVRYDDPFEPAVDLAEIEALK